MFEKDPRTFAPTYKNLNPEQKAMVKLEITVTKFFKELERSIIRWERLLYPTVFVFGILGLSGFYLIYSMTEDMHTVSQSVDPQMQDNLAKMSANMAELSQNIALMTVSLSKIVEKMDSMDTNVSGMNHSVQDMRNSLLSVDTSITEMNKSIQGMNLNTGVMSRDMNMMNRNISAPASFFNRMAPW
jgi:hypothetical protein